MISSLTTFLTVTVTVRLSDSTSLLLALTIILTGVSVSTFSGATYVRIPSVFVLPSLYSTNPTSPSIVASNVVSSSLVILISILPFSLSSKTWLSTSTGVAGFWGAAGTSFTLTTTSVGSLTCESLLAVTWIVTLLSPSTAGAVYLTLIPSTIAVPLESPPSTVACNVTPSTLLKPIVS